MADLKDFKVEPNFWDAIISIWCHVPEEIRKPLHKKVVLGLKQDGILILESYEPKQLLHKTGGPPTAELMMTAESIKFEFQGLSFETLQQIELQIHEGQGHQGLSAVVQCVAKKI